MLAPAEEPGSYPGDAIFCFFASFVCLFFFLCSIWFLVRFFLLAYRKIPKISPGAYIFQRPLIFEGLIFGGAYIRRGLCMEGNLRFKID